MNPIETEEQLAELERRLLILQSAFDSLAVAVLPMIESLQGWALDHR